MAMVSLGHTGSTIAGWRNDTRILPDNGRGNLGYVLYSKRGYLMTMVVYYKSKKALKEQVGKPLKYVETSLFGPEYRDDGVLTVSNRPHITGLGREFFAQVYMVNGIIQKVT